MQYVYIIKCSNNTYYVGCTNNIKDRINRHGKGEVKATCYRLPFELKILITFTDKYSAYRFEKYLKSGSGRAFMNKHLI